MCVNEKINYVLNWICKFWFLYFLTIKISWILLLFIFHLLFHFSAQSWNFCSFMLFLFVFKICITRESSIIIKMIRILFRMFKMFSLIKMIFSFWFFMSFFRIWKFSYLKQNNIWIWWFFWFYFMCECHFSVRWKCNRTHSWV